MTQAVRIQREGDTVYAYIHTTQRHMAVMIDPKQPASIGMQRAAAELREKAARLVKQAEFIEAAADWL